MAGDSVRSTRPACTTVANVSHPRPTASYALAKSGPDSLFRSAYRRRRAGLCEEHHQRENRETTSANLHGRVDQCRCAHFTRRRRCTYVQQVVGTKRSNDTSESAKKMKKCCSSRERAMEMLLTESRVRTSAKSPHRQARATRSSAWSAMPTSEEATAARSAPKACMHSSTVHPPCMKSQGVSVAAGL